MTQGELIKQPESFTDLCKRLEHFETPEWAARAILKREILTQYVIDPCCGTGVLTQAAIDRGYDLLAIDIHDWGFPGTEVRDFLSLKFDELRDNGKKVAEFTVFKNPPFSLATDFVEKSFELGARKIVCFQRFAWWESAKRRAFWEKYPPVRVYICGDRATCFRHDLPKDDEGNRLCPTTRKKLGNVPIPHAWFVFERGHKGGTMLDHIWREDAA